MEIDGMEVEMTREMKMEVGRYEVGDEDTDGGGGKDGGELGSEDGGGGGGEDRSEDGHEDGGGDDRELHHLLPHFIIFSYSVSSPSKFITFKSQILIHSLV